MDEVKPKPKVLRDVDIPVEVVSALQEIWALLDEGDWRATLPSDDCLQIGCLCGGLMDDGSGRFYFSVHLPANRHYVWDVVLTKADIAGVLAGTKMTLRLWCCTNEQCGFKTYIDNITCSWCDCGHPRAS